MNIPHFNSLLESFDKATNYMFDRETDYLTLAIIASAQGHYELCDLIMSRVADKISKPDK